MKLTLVALGVRSWDSMVATRSWVDRPSSPSCVPNMCEGLRWWDMVIHTKQKSHKGTRVSVHCLHKSFTSFLRFKVRSAKYSTQTPPTPAFPKQSTIHEHQKKRRSSSEVHPPNNPHIKQKTSTPKSWTTATLEWPTGPLIFLHMFCMKPSLPKTSSPQNEL